MALFDGQLGFDDAEYSDLSTVTITGEVQNSIGGSISRKVYAYHSLDLTRSVADTVSSASTGEFSLDLPGVGTTEFTILVVGEAGENCSVHSHKTGT